MRHRPALKRPILIAAGLLLAAFFTAACSGQAGPSGPEGPQGLPGPQGAAGPPGEVVSAAPEYVGSAVCAQCHQDIYNTYEQSGHASMLTAVVDGQAPDYPYSSVPNPPSGYTWDDILYVIGGYGWKALFIDQNGYIITGDDAQYNLRNDDLLMGPSTTAYHSEEENVPYDCGTCHTTGYSNWPPNSHQDGLPGLVGTWAEDGVACEACHGPGSLHASNPGNLALRPTINRDSELCGTCHTSGDPAEIDATGTLVAHHEQYEDFYQSKHRALNCVDCHDPHSTAIHAEDAVAAGYDPGINSKCQSCHWQEATFQPAGHNAPTCIDCHMAPIGTSALADQGRLRGDMPSHLFAINPYADSQFYDANGTEYSEPYLTVPYACTRCHYSGGIVEDTNTMRLFAQGYHDPTRSAAYQESHTSGE